MCQVSTVPRAPRGGRGVTSGHSEGDRDQTSSQVRWGQPGETCCTPEPSKQPPPATTSQQPGPAWAFGDSPVPQNTEPAAGSATNGGAASAVLTVSLLCSAPCSLPSFPGKKRGKNIPRRSRGGRTQREQSVPVARKRREGAAGSRELRDRRNGAGPAAGGTAG